LIAENRALNETVLGERTFPIRINVHRSDLYSHLIFKWLLIPTCGIFQ